MWQLAKRFAFGSLLGGIVVSFVCAFLLRRPGYTFLQLCAGYTFPACVSGLVYGVAASAIGRAREKDTAPTLLLGASGAAVQYPLALLVPNPGIQTLLLVATPIVAAAMMHALVRRTRGCRAETCQEPPRHLRGSTPQRSL